MDVDFVRPGDRIELVGIYRAVGNRVNSSQRTLKNIYKTFIDVITYVKSDKKRYNDNEN
jgi:DNA replication licensing factor MCM4